MLLPLTYNTIPLIFSYMSFLSVTFLLHVTHIRAKYVPIRWESRLAGLVGVVGLSLRPLVLKVLQGHLHGMGGKTSTDFVQREMSKPKFNLTSLPKESLRGMHPSCRCYPVERGKNRRHSLVNFHFPSQGVFKYSLSQRKLFEGKRGKGIHLQAGMLRESDKKILFPRSVFHSV